MHARHEGRCAHQPVEGELNFVRAKEGARMGIGKGAVVRRISTFPTKNMVSGCDRRETYCMKHRSIATFVGRKILDAVHLLFTATVDHILSKMWSVPVTTAQGTTFRHFCTSALYILAQVLLGILIDSLIECL